MVPSLKKVGLFAEYDANWIAGVLYVQTILRALRHLAGGEIERMDLLMHRSLDAELYEPFADSLNAIHRYDLRPADAPGRRRRIWRRSLLQRGRFPVDLGPCAERLGLDVVLPTQKALGRDFPVPWIGWIPDFQHKRLPELFSNKERARRDARHQELIDQSNHMMVSSDDALADMAEHYRVDPERVSVYKFCTHADPQWFVGDPAGVADRYELPEKFLIFPSQYWEHKEHLTLFKAIDMLRRSGHPDLVLVLTGRKADYRDSGYPDRLDAFVRDNQLGQNVRHLGLLPRIDQIQLMRRACAVVQPSKFEGWSMLVEDCRALGKAMILSDIPVHREQAYDKVVYFATGSAEALAAGIEELWKQVKAGPDLSAEAEARNRNQVISERNGRHLLGIIERSIASKRS